MGSFNPKSYGAKKSKLYTSASADNSSAEKTQQVSTEGSASFDPSRYGDGKSKLYSQSSALIGSTSKTKSSTTATKSDTGESFLSRAWNTITGGLKGSAAGNMDAMGVAYQATQGGRTQQNTEGLRDAQWALARAKKAYDTDKSSASAAELDTALKQMKAYATVLGDGAYEQALKAAYSTAEKIGTTTDLNALYHSLGTVNVNASTGVQQKATEAARDLAGKVQQSGSSDIERAKSGLGTFGQMLVDAGASMAQMGGDLAANAVLSTPGSMIPFAARAFGGGTMQARENGADLGQQIAYGAALSGKEVLTEKMFNIALPFAKAYGGGALDDMTQRTIQTAVDKLGKTAAGKRALNAALQLTASGVSEGLEELIGDWMEWQMPRIYGGDVDTASETLANSLYDFVVGGMAGVAGSVISPNTYRYGNYAADVQENTATEMSEKAAQAVDAVTRGETITGNQAAEIARNPVAVETLEANTGVKLDTEQPIGQLKRDIIALASLEAAQEQAQPTTATPQTQKRTERRVGGFMEAGQNAFRQMSEMAENPAELYAGFSSVYNAGLNGIEADKARGEYAARLTPEQRYAAYNAGLEDAAAQVVRENTEAASVTTTAGAGLADNEYSRYLIAIDKNKASALNAIGKKLGVRIEFVDSVFGGNANGQYIKDKNLIQIAMNSDKPIMNVAAHEITHRMQDLSPAEYRELRRAAIEARMARDGADTEAEAVEWYREAAEKSGVTLTQDEVMDEITADFVGSMIEDVDLFARFAKENRTAAQRLLDGLKEFLAKVKAALTGKARDKAAQDAYGTRFAELEAVAEKWQTAFDAAAKQAENAKTAAQEGSGAKYQIKYDTENKPFVVVEEDILDGVNPSKWVTTVKKNLAEKFPNGVHVGNNDIKINHQTRQEMTFSEYTQWLSRNDKAAYADKFRATNYADEIILASRDYINEGLKHTRKDNIRDFARGTVLLRIGANDYQADVIVGGKRNGDLLLYDVVNMQKTEINEKKKHIVPPIQKESSRSDALHNTSISPNGENVKQKFSLKATDSAGRQLSEEQQEDFKESGRVKTAAGEGGGAKYSLKNTTDKNVVSIKQQIANTAQELNAAEPVVRKTVSEIFGGMNIKQKRAWAEAEALKYGNRVDRQGYGEIEVSRKDVNSALNYLQSDGEIAAFSALPYVLKRGNEIYREANHKGRGYSTVTFAAPVVINGTRGNMAVVVRETSKNHYDMHRIVMPDGSAFTFTEKTNAETGPTAATSSTDALTQPTASTSKTSIPTDGENVNRKFSLKAPVEETKNLLALHNLTEKNLLDAAKLGGLPMPSIAIVKADAGHGDYGGISFVFSKDTIDPQLFRSNKVYGGDAWTPTAPRVDYAVNSKRLQEIEREIHKLAGAVSVGGGIFGNSAVLRSMGIDDTSSISTEEIAKKLANTDTVRAAYLADKGGTLEAVKKPKQWDKFGNDTLKKVVDRIGTDKLAEIISKLELGESSTSAIGGNEKVIREVLREHYRENVEPLLRKMAVKRRWNANEIDEKRQARIDRAMENNVTPFTLESVVRHAWEMYEDGGATSGEVDRLATSETLRSAVNDSEVEAWIAKKIDGLLGEAGIYNGKDLYTASGNPRSFSQLHYAYTLENIVKAMKETQSERGSGVWGITAKTLQAVATPEYGSIAEIKVDSGRLFRTENADYEAMLKTIDAHIEKVIEKVKKSNTTHSDNSFIESDIIGGIMLDAAKGKKTVDAIVKAFAKEGYKISSQTAQDIQSVYKTAAQMPTGYFEAKPQRAVGFDEVLAAVIPDDTSAEVKAALKNAGVRMIEYASGNEKSRLDAVNSVEGARFQLRGTADIEQEMRDLKRERTALASRNRALEQRVQELKGEMRLSKEPSVVQRDVKRLGREVIRRYGSDAKWADIENDMSALSKAAMKRDVSMSDLMLHAKKAAETIVDNSVEMTENGAELLEIRDHLKKQHIRFDGDMNDYNSFRKKHFGTLKLNKSQGTPVDTIYAELTELFGEGYFPGDIYTEADKLDRIGEVLDGIDSIYRNPFESYREAAVQEIANDIVDGMISDQVRQKKTFADRKAFEQQEAVGRVRRMLTKEREKRQEAVKRMRRDYSEKTKQGREKRNATALRAKIARHTGAISEGLVNPTDKKHIPEELRVTVASLLRNINLESAYSYDENGRLRKNAGGDPTGRTLAAEKLKRIYQDIIDREGNLVVDPDLMENGGLLSSLAELGGKRIADMNVTELETVWDAVRAIENTLRTYNRTLANAKYETTAAWAEDIAMGSMSRRRRNRKISLDFADPYTFFSAYGDGGMQVYRTLRNAQDREHVMLAELRDAAKKFLDSKVYETRFERHTFTTGRGVELTLTTEQIMNLYNLAKRGEQAIHHMEAGGIVQPEIKRNGTLKAIKRGTENILLTVDDIRTIVNTLTPEQRKVADGLQKLASTRLAEWGNEASMAVYGYRKFKEEHYWPIKAAKEAVNTTVEKDSDNPRSIKNMGSAKALTPNASNALDIDGVYDVFAQNASDMIKYATLLAPMEDINRLYNFRYRDSMGNLTGRNMQQVLSGVYGDGARAYWRNLMRDVQNGMVKNASETTKAVERIVGNTKGAAVGANMSVVIQQPTAYFRAAAILSPEDMARGLAGGATKGSGWNKARQYAPIAGIKDTSGFDQGSRYTIAREVYGTNSFMDKLNDKSMALAGMADAVTWGKIWNACEWQVSHEGNYELGSEAFYHRVAEVFTDVIDQSQVVDGIMQRTQIMRDGDALTRQATAFMGEPLKSLNMLMRAYDAWRFENDTQKRSRALKQLKRNVGALLVTDVMNALAQSIVDGLRDDDKDKKYVERVLEAFIGISGDEENGWERAKNIKLAGNLAGNITLVGRIPYAKDILSILQGYTVDRMDAGAFDDIVKATKSMIASANGEGKKTVAYSLKQVITATSKIFGVSVANLGRDVWAVVRSVATDTHNVMAMYEMEKAIYRVDQSAGNGTRYYKILVIAKQYDEEAYNAIYDDMLSHGWSEDKLKNGMKSVIKASSSQPAVMQKQLEDIGFSKEEAMQTIATWNFKDRYGYSYTEKADAYKSGAITKTQLISEMMKIDDVSREEAEQKIAVYDWQKDGLDIEAGETGLVSNWNEYGSPNGISRSDFIAFYHKASSTKGEDYDGDGKTDSGSKKEKVVAIIDGLPLTAAQKDALYYQQGYAARDISKTPWH